MAVRTSADQIKLIIEVDDVIELTAFIETASSLVDEVCGEAGYSDTRLELIERWLAAHFYAIRDPRRTSEAVRGLSEHFESKVDLGLQLTRYGQQALMLDTKGGLAALNNIPKNANNQQPGISYLGPEY